MSIDISFLTALTWNFIFFVCWAPCFAEVRLPSIIGDNMVVQQGMRVPLWGWAEPGERIVVEIADQVKRTKADSQGRWNLKLDPLGGKKTLEMTVAGQNKLKIQNILVGEVWLCGGQSNMQMGVAKGFPSWNKGVTDYENEVKTSYFPKIRLFSVPPLPSEVPMEDCEGQWKLCQPESAQEFSAVGYFFGRELYKARQVPIGLIHCSRGGTAAEAWMRKSFLESNSEWKKWLIDYEWPERRKPRRLIKGPYVFYNGMLNSIIPYGIKGVIWYQGEANRTRAYQYRELFPGTISNWRQDWGQGAFPFLFVQLANWGPFREKPGESVWAELREAQLLSTKVPNTGMVVTIDVGDGNDVHFPNKKAVGERLAKLARGTVYGEDIVYSGPVYESMRIEGSAIRLFFKHVSSGLVAKGGEPLKHFAIADVNKKFIWANAKIDGNTIIVSSKSVKSPVAVRYAWADNPLGANLYNTDGLPASPFRTDSWEGITANKHVMWPELP